MTDFYSRFANQSTNQARVMLHSTVLQTTGSLPIDKVSDMQESAGGTGNGAGKTGERKTVEFVFDRVATTNGSKHQSECWRLRV